MLSSPKKNRLRRRLLLGALAVASLLSSCSTTSYIVTVSDLPLKDTKLPGMDWQLSSKRANAQYVLYGANSNKERTARLGDYYYVLWYDAQPSTPARVEMLYTQAATASKVLTSTVELTQPRSSRGTRKTVFIFNGPLRAQRGDVLTWRINLYSDGKLVDSHRSYLWMDPEDLWQSRLPEKQQGQDEVPKADANPSQEKAPPMVATDA